MKTAIVTGAYGYIGSVLSKLLKENGYYVIGIDNKLHNDFLERTKYCDLFINKDFISEESLKVIKNNKTATIFHLAANSLLGPSAKDPLTYFENNTSKTLTLLKNISETNNFIFSSTAAVYAVSDKSVSENDKIDPPNNYGLSKLYSENMMKVSYNITNNKIICFRFFNVIGAYEDVGQELGTPHIISKLCESAIKNKTFFINGDDYPTKDGTCVRDYLSVIDVCRAMIHADNFLKTKSGSYFDIFNLGTNKGTSVKQIVDLFVKNCSKIEIKNYKKRIGDPPYLVANPEKFIKETGFKYLYNEKNLEEMIKSAWRYLR